MSYRLQESIVVRPGIFTLVAWWAVLLGAEDIAGSETTSAAEVFQTDSHGIPPQYQRLETLKGPHFFLWREGDVWRVRTKAGEKGGEFSGTIRTVGGTVTRISNYSGLEGPRKGNGKKADVGRLDGSRRTISFRLRTKGREDGFDFTVNPNTERLEFDLRVDGYGHRERILIGGKGKRPPGPTFSLRNVTE
jgi:hypothetical protein